MFDSILNYLIDFFTINSFGKLGLVVTTIIIFVGISRLLKQPSIIGYVLAGIILGPQVLGFTQNLEGLEFFGHLGVTLLIFIVGLGLNPKIIRELTGVSLLIGISQVVVSFLGGYTISTYLGFSSIDSMYLGLGLAFSSTIIAIKLLSDSNEGATLYGKIVTGILVVQDILAMIALMFVNITSSFSGDFDFFAITGILVIKGGVLSVLFFLLSKYILPFFIKKIAISQEYLFIFSLGWCLFVGTMFSIFGFSTEIGALVAGIGLASSPYKHLILSKMKSLRDFFVSLFFVFLGTQINFLTMGHYITQIIVFTLFILVGRTLLVMGMMGSMYYKKKNSFLTAITTSQISEFGSIIAGIGIFSGHIVNSDILSIISFVLLVSMIFSTYLYKYRENIYKNTKKLLSIFERKEPKAEKKHLQKRKKKGAEIIVFGYGTVGRKLVESLINQNKSFFVIDSDPDIIEELREKGIPHIYGDAEENDLLDNEEISLKNTNIVIGTINSFDGSMTILQSFKKGIYKNRKVSVILVSHDEQEAVDLYDAGADYVLMPHHIGAHHTMLLLEEYGWDENNFIQKKLKHIEELKI